MEPIDRPGTEHTGFEVVLFFELDDCAGLWQTSGSRMADCRPPTAVPVVAETETAEGAVTGLCSCAAKLRLIVGKALSGVL